MLKVLGTIRPVFKDRMTTEMDATMEYIAPHVPETLPDEYVLPSLVVMATPEPADEPADDKMVDLEAEDSTEEEAADSGLRTKTRWGRGQSRCALKMKNGRGS